MTSKIGSSRDPSSTLATVLVSGFLSSLATIFIQRLSHRLARKKERLSLDRGDEQYQNPNTTIGPEIRPETRYELNLRGKVDKIFEHHGPKPFKFNHEVVEVFDDMVSRSVPLYCEVTDLAIYWMQRYYQAGTSVYDLGCSTGTTIDVLARSFINSERCHFIGVDNSEAMVEASKDKLQWVNENHSVEVHCGDILNHVVENASFVIMNYTLQFIPIPKRQSIFQSIYAGLCEGGVFFLSEKVRVADSEMQETCTWIYEDFKSRRKYTKRQIARKRDALMNVLVPFTEGELKNSLNAAGFKNVEIVAKWNNFTTFVCQKISPLLRGVKGDKMKQSESKKKLTPHLDKLFDPCPIYLNDYMEPRLLQLLCSKRAETFAARGNLSDDWLKKYDQIACMMQQFPFMKSSKLIFNEKELTIGDQDELSPQLRETLGECLRMLCPWKKGPLNLFGTKIDTEWRSDWKWGRLQKSLPNLKDMVVCDLGCGNGYYMFRMLEYEPKLVVGIDPNIHAFLEFKLLQRFSGVENVQFELLRGDVMSMFIKMFDVVFCLGVLYHTNDPIGMLRDVYESMKGGSTLVVDCQGIPGDNPVALFPRKRYANMRGVYFLPTLSTLKNWLQRANFLDFEVIFSEALSTEEQRKTDWAQISSLEESLNPNDPLKTIEGYPAPHRFYVRVRK